MSIPIITDNRQKLYEKILINTNVLIDNIPQECGKYGRTCINNNANSVICKNCSLSIFVQTVEEIIKKCDEKESLGIKYLYDSDISDIETSLREKSIIVKYSYIEKLLTILSSINE